MYMVVVFWVIMDTLPSDFVNILIYAAVTDSILVYYAGIGFLPHKKVNLYSIKK